MNSSLKNKEDALILIDASEYVIAKPFFVDFKINQPILHSMLENKSAGKIFTDDVISPSFMLVCSSAGYVFLGGEPDLASLKKVALHLKTLSYVSLVCPFEWKLKNFFLEEGFVAIDRIQFYRPKTAFWTKKLPVQYSMNRIDKDNFPMCSWYSFILNYYGDCDRFFANGLGWCLRDQGKVISESYGLIAGDQVEIGVITHENYRGQNLGTAICATLLDYCSEYHLRPFWNCNLDNPASIAIAKKLGFEEECRYFFLRWIKT